MKVITVLNQKGGVGKSTTVSSVMAYLTKKGYRVLGIDTDTQGHLSKICKAKTENENTVLELLKRDAEIQDCIQCTEFGDIIPADYNLQLSILQFASIPDFMFRMSEITESIKDKYDYVIIDCPPSIQCVTTSTLVATDYVIIPTEAEYLSLDGVQELERTINVVQKKLNTKLNVMGLLITKYNPRRKLTQELEEMFSRSAKEKFGADILPVKIRTTVDIPMTQALQKSIFDYKPNCEVAKEYAELCEEIIRRTK